MKVNKHKSSLKGLLPFEPEDFSSFYYNKNEIETFFRSLHSNKFIFITGPEGSGKTSFLNCVAAAQVSHFFDQDPHEWEVARCRLGPNPIKSLATAIAKANINTRKTSVEENIVKTLEKGAHGLVKVFNENPLDDEKCLLLIIDNLEDIFYLRDLPQFPKKTMKSFINLLWTFEKQSTFRVYVAVSFSEKFKDQIIAYPKLISLFHKANWSFTGLGIHDIGSVIKKIIPDELNHSASQEIEEKIKIKLQASDPIWRLLMNYQLKLTFNLWYEGYFYVHDELLKHQVLKNLVEAQGLPALVNDLLLNESKKYTPKPNSKEGELWDKLEDRAKEEVQKIVQLAKTNRKTLSLMDCYNEADKQTLEQKIYSAIDHKNDPKSSEDQSKSKQDRRENNKELLQSLIRSLTAAEKGFRPLRFKDLIAIMGVGGAKKNKVKKIIYKLGNDGFGIFLTIPSGDIKEGLSKLDEIIAVDDNTIICVRNAKLLGQIPDFKKWTKDEHKCISAYSTYSRLDATFRETLPPELQHYALLGKKEFEDKEFEKNEHSKIVYELLHHKNETWAKSHIAKEEQMSGFQKTIKFIHDKIEEWKDIKREGEQQYKKKEQEADRKLKRTFMAAATIVLIIMGFIAWLQMTEAQEDMIQQFQCLQYERLRINSLIHENYIEKLEDDNTNLEYEDSVHVWTNVLNTRANQAQLQIEAISDQSLWEFIPDYSSWKRLSKSLNTDSSRRKDILKRAIAEGLLKKEVEQILPLPGYYLYGKYHLPAHGQYYLNCSCSEED